MEMTLDRFYGVAKYLVETDLAQKHPTEDGFQVEVNCLLNISDVTDPPNLVSHRLEGLVLCYGDAPFYQKYLGTLPNLKRLLLCLRAEDFFTLAPNWRKECGLPDSCRLEVLGFENDEGLLPYYPASCFSKEDLAYSRAEPVFAHAGHNYGHKDWLEARGWSLDKLSNIGFYVQGQPCPWGELLPTGPCQVRITYPKFTEWEDNKVTEARDPKSAKRSQDGQSAEGDKVVPLACLKTMPNDILLIIFEQLNPLDKLSMIKAAPGLCPLILSTMKHDFTLQKNLTRYPGVHQQIALWTFKTANPRAENPEEFTLIALPYGHGFSVLDGQALRSFRNYFCGVLRL